MNNRGSDGTGCFEIKIRTDTTKLTNMRKTRSRKRRHLIRETEVFIENKTKIANRVSGVE